MDARVHDTGPAALVRVEVLPVDARECAQLALVPDGERTVLVCVTEHEVVAWGSFATFGATREDADWREERRVLLEGYANHPVLSVRRLDVGTPILFAGGTKDGELTIHAWRPGETAAELASPPIAYDEGFYVEEETFFTGLSGAGPNGRSQVFGEFTWRGPGPFLVDAAFVTRRLAEGGPCRGDCIPWLHDRDGRVLSLVSPVVESDSRDSFVVVGRHARNHTVVRFTCTKASTGATCTLRDTARLPHELGRPALARCGGGYLAGVRAPGDEEDGRWLTDYVLLSDDFEVVGRLPYRLAPDRPRGVLHAGRRHCAVEYSVTEDGHASLLTYRGAIGSLVEESVDFPEVDIEDARRLHTNEGLGIAVTSATEVRLLVL